MRRGWRPFTITALDLYATEAVAELQTIKGIEYPLGVLFGQLLITGPPGAGKTTQISRIGGWPEEGAVDLCAPHWWRSRDLSIRPREVHLCLPFQGWGPCLSVFAQEWEGGEPPLLDASRIRIPPPKRHFLSVDWRSRFLFEFLLPSAETIHSRRLQRREREYHPDDEALDANTVPPVIEAQLQRFWQAALILHCRGMQVIVRDSCEHPPRRFVAEQA